MAETLTPLEETLTQIPKVPPKLSIASDVLKLASGTTFAQLLGILASPIMARLYAPEAYGMLTIFTSITAIFGIIACLRYEMAIMLPPSDEEAANLLGVSLLLAALVSLIIVPLVWWQEGSLLKWLNLPEYQLFKWFLPPVVFAVAAFSALNYWNSRNRRFGQLSIARVIHSLFTTTTQLSLGFAGFTTGGTMIGVSVGGQFFITGILGGQIWRNDRKLFRKAITWFDMFVGAKRYRKFPLYDTWSTLLNTISWQLPALLLSSFFSPAIVGYYALGYRILQVPMNLIGGAIGQVFFQRASDAKMQNNLNVVVENMFKNLVVIGLYPILMLTLIGRDLFATIFGSNWAEAGVYTQLLGVWAFLWFVSSPLGTVFSILEKQEFLLKWNVVNFFTRFASLYVGGIMHDPRMAVILFSGTGIIVYGYMVLSIMFHSGIALCTPFQIIGKSLFTFLPAGVILILLLVVGAKTELRLAVAGFLLVGYYLLMSMRHPAYWNQLKNSIRRP